MKTKEEKIKLNLELTKDEMETIYRALFYQNIEYNGWGSPDNEYNYLMKFFKNK